MQRFKKTSLGSLNLCYAVNVIIRDGVPYYVFAADGPGSCIIVNSESLEAEEIWSSPGGTMSIIPIPGANGDFLASQRFLPGFAAKHSRIVRVSYRNGWQVTPLIDIPYVHRFDIIEAGGRKWLLAAILSCTENETADFSRPGCMKLIQLDDGYTPFGPTYTIPCDMSENHGYFRGMFAGEEWILAACQEGVFRIHPAERPEDWQAEKLIGDACSDISLCDLNGDEQPEIVAISPFHGEILRVYELKDGSFVKTFSAEHNSSFLHGIWSGVLGGETVAVIGGRDGKKETLLLCFKDGEYRTELVESGFGMSNLTVFENKMIFANREAGEMAVFSLE